MTYDIRSLKARVVLKRGIDLQITEINWISLVIQNDFVYRETLAHRVEQIMVSRLALPERLLGPPALIDLLFQITDSGFFFIKHDVQRTQALIKFPLAF